MIVDGIGSPIEPLNSGSSSLLMQAPGEVSVRPQAWVSVLPVTCFQRSATARCTAMPPPRLTLSALKSRRSKPGVLQQRIEQRVHAGEEREAVLAELLDEAGEVARIRDQHVVRAELDERQAVPVSEKM